jgi:acetylornithine deacetylase
MVAGRFLGVRQTMTERTIAILEKLVGFDTTSRNSNLELIDWIEGELAAQGIAGVRSYDDGGVKANLFATIGPVDVPGYVLSGHTDVVPVDGQAWTSDPFRLTRRGDRLYGRGACDMKGFLASCLAAVPDMLARPLARPIHLAFSYDEEVGCLGVPRLIARMGDAGLAPAACFVGEPTSMQVVVAHKTKVSYRVVVTGKSVHSALAPQGVNAVDYAARLVVHLQEINRRLAVGPSDGLFDVPVSTAHTGTIAGGTALNIVPEHCEFLFEFRTLPDVDVDALFAEVEAFARDVLEPEMRAVDPATGIRIEWLSGFPGLDTSPEAPVVALAKRLAGRNDHGKVAYGTEAGLFFAAAVPTVVVGPGSIEQAHKPDEFIAVSELARCDAFVGRLIEHCAA